MRVPKILNQMAAHLNSDETTIIKTVGGRSGAMSFVCNVDYHTLMADTDAGGRVCPDVRADTTS